MTRAAVTKFVVRASVVLLATSMPWAVGPRDLVGQKPATANCRVEGVAISDDAGAPVKGVRVKLDYVPPMSEEQPPLETREPVGRPLGWLPMPGAANTDLETDEAGRFQVSGLAAGRYRLTVTAPAGFVLAGRWRLIDLTESRSTSVVLRLDRTGGLTGRLLTDKGKGVAGGTVSLLRWSGGPGGPRRLTPAAFGDGAARRPAVSTDPNGEFSFREVPAGQYYLVAHYQPRVVRLQYLPRKGPVPTYYPGTTLLKDAVQVTVASGEVRAKADFAIVEADRSTLSVTARDVRGALLPRSPYGYVTLRPASDERAAPSSTAAFSPGGPDQPDGTWTFPGVPAGRYYVVASLLTDQDPGGGRVPRMRSADGRSFWDRETGYRAVTVEEGKNQSLKIATTAGATLSGRVIVEGTPGPTAPQWEPIVVSARNVGTMAVGPLPRVETDRDGHFTLDGIVGMTVLGAQTRGVLKSVTIGGRDVTGQPLELSGTERLTDIVMTVTTDTATLAGTVTTQNPEALLVVAFPDDPARCLPGTPWVRVLRLQTETPVSAMQGAPGTSSPGATAGTTTRFAVPHLLPGRYHVALVTERGQDPVFDREALDKLRSAATAVTLTAGETTSVALTQAKR